MPVREQSEQFGMLPMVDLRRRDLLKRLGLAVGASYVAPALLHLSGARASEASAGSGSSISSRAVSAPSLSFSKSDPNLEALVLLPTSASLTVLDNAGFLVLSSRPVPLLNGIVARISLPQGLTLVAVRSQIAALVPEAQVEANDLYGTSELTCDEAGCAAFDMVGWRPNSACSGNIRIGLVDTRVNADHPSLAGQRLRFLAIGTDSRAASGQVHGTALAALLVGRGDSRTPGLLPGAELLVAEAFFTTGSGDAADAYRLIAALDVLSDEAPLAINMSLAGPDNPLLARTISAIADLGIAVVAAVGNGGPGAVSAYPAAYPSVVAVTAVDRDSRAYRQAGRGPHVDFAAPGVNLWTAASVSGGRLRTGTSFAAPFVTAAIAAARASTPSTSVESVVSALAANAIDLGDPGRDPVFGHGLVQSACSVE